MLHCPPLSRDQATRREGVRVTFLNADGTLLNANGTLLNADGTLLNPDGTLLNPDGTLSVILSEAKNLSNLERD